MTSRMIPLNELRFGHEATPPINARRVGREDEIAELAASIHAHGLITPPKVKEIARTFYVGIGNRRLAAMRLLVEQGQLAPDWLVTCDEFDGDIADPREIALAEQIMRAPLHEADQLEEFTILVDAGLSEASIASRFGIEPQRVKKILALGRLSPVILDAWRQGAFDREPAGCVRAFTLAPSIEAQEAVFAKLHKNNNLHAHAIRQAFGANNHEAAKAIKIAGVEAYTDAGGRMTTDLFGDNHVIEDPEIAVQVAEAKIEATLTGLRAEGWSWVSTADDLPYSWTYSWGTEKPAEGKATAGEKKAIKKLEKAAAKGTDGAADDLAALQKAIAERQWTPEQLARAGAVLTISHYGDLNIKRGVVKPHAAKKAASADADGTKEKAAPTISNALAMRLSAQAGLATRKALQAEPRLGLIALLAGFLTKRDMYSGARLCPIHVSHEGMGYQQLRGTELFQDALERLQAMTDSELFVVAAGIAGNAVDLHVSSSEYKAFDGAPAALAAAIDADNMTAALHETFDAADYFGGVSKSFVIDAIREAINDDEARRADKLKKKELVDFAVENVAGTGWLPPELRAPTYSGPGERPAIAAPALEEDPDFAEIDEEEAA
ncbi:ParB family chromosome partitioning protein [Aminobacter niigataensis]|uniref:ParB family chromosome partitioning protein n=1 Tax=Aminobacter niigataensis TaxID=83265 RepID=A0ABR6L853_9HYPH|nr:ParB/RepB/Spo0J family partition protein [Aminobacter niigataensis]MBB4652983.1 ParB family chromosome partitioning protein [Aminobacter niigataensis]